MRTDIEFFARDLEARGRARATITRGLCTVAGFYRYAVEEELPNLLACRVAISGPVRAQISHLKRCFGS